MTKKERKQPTPIMITNDLGKKLWVLDTDFLGKRNIKGKPFQNANLRFVQKKIKKGKMALDVGGSIGMNAIMYAEFFDRVLCFEPDPIAHDLLQRTVEANNADNVATYQRAVGDRCGTATMNCFDRLTGLSSFVFFEGEKDTTQYEVDMTTIDSFDFINVDLLKIDVEGFEMEAIRGAAVTIARCKPLIQVEIDHLDEVQPLYDLIFSIDPSYYAVMNTGHSEMPTKGGKEYRFVRGKIDRFFLHGDKFKRKGFF